MRQNTGMILEPKRNNKIRTAKFISARGITSKAEIARALNLSMPTTLANVKELIRAGIVTEEGEYESLVITLGNGLGENFWCVLFPPLCLLDTEEEVEDVEYTSFVKELIDKYF